MKVALVIVVPPVDRGAHMLQRRRGLYEPIPAMCIKRPDRNLARQVDDRRWMMAFQRERTERCPSAERSIHPQMRSRTNSAGEGVGARPARTRLEATLAALAEFDAGHSRATSAAEDRQCAHRWSLRQASRCGISSCKREACGLRDMRYVAARLPRTAGGRCAHGRAAAGRAAAAQAASQTIERAHRGKPPPID